MSKKRNKHPEQPCARCGKPLPPTMRTEKTLMRTLVYPVIEEADIARENGRRVHKGCQSNA